MTTSLDTGWAPRAQRLADLLAERGDLRDPAWKDAVAAVARHVLVPAAYRQDNTGAWQPVDVTSPEGLDLVYSPTTLVTALADRGTHQESVSSSTKPDLVVRMLEILSIHDEHKVLDIGTGTGYNAALLAHRLGDNQVYSVDIDDELIEGARHRLDAIGVRPTLVTADGAAGLPQHAPYDRIIVTCSVPAVPWAWAEQLRPDGKVLVDIKVATEAGNLALLHRYPDRLEGRFTSRWASFMAMRHHYDQAHESWQPRAEHTTQRTTTTPANPWYDNRVVWLLAHLHGLPPGGRIGMQLDPATRQPTDSLLSAADGSWAAVSLANHDGHHDVVEGGPTALWEHVERAHQLWLDHDQPDWPRLGLTVTPEHQHLWIDTPDATSWPLPSTKRESR
ncbi:MAG: methyltransferase domain-containing protein [Pseudonocardiaceae bacterium]